MATVSHHHSMPSLAALVNDAPPGELDAVRRDIEVLSGSSSAVARELATETAKANVAQLRIVSVNGELTVLSKHNQLDNTTFVTHGANPQKFEIDHETRETKVLGKADEPSERVAELQAQVDKYVAQHYAAESVAAVFGHNALSIVIVGRKLSPQNFHNGQLSAEYTVESGDRLRGQISADVHYFEEGNVRLKSTKPINLDAPEGIAKAIARAESEFETGLNRTLVGLNEREFKALRRQLPVTRQPMMWGKAVAGYKLGKELENR